MECSSLFLPIRNTRRDLFRKYGGGEESYFGRKSLPLQKVAAPPSIFLFRFLSPFAPVFPGILQPAPAFLPTRTDCFKRRKKTGLAFRLRQSSPYDPEAHPAGECNSELGEAPAGDTFPGRSKSSCCCCRLSSALCPPALLRMRGLLPGSVPTCRAILTVAILCCCCANRAASSGKQPCRALHHHPRLAL